MNDMWETTRSTSPVTAPMRRLLKFVLTAFIAVLLVLTVLPNNIAHAVDNTATWNNGSIIYNGNTYSGPADDQTVANLKLPKGTQVYSYVDPAPSTTTGTTTTTGPPQQIHVIFFASGVDTKTASKAKYITYTYVNFSTFKDQSNPSDISIDPQSSTTGTGGTAGSGGSSCVVDGGIGWIVCPISNFIAKGMDTVFDILTGFLKVQPLQTGQDSPLMRGWEYTRNIANIAFVITFLIIIYSQITGLGVSSYGLRKLLPRLIIAAVLVNISYFICSIAVDISNILGYSIQDLFTNIRNSLVGNSNGWSGQVLSWQSVTGFVLAGGTAATVGSIALVTTLSSAGVGGSVILLLPALVSGLLAVLVALIVLAARQAIIVVLTLIAPLAFVAYLLPNTEKWFEKWRSLFMNMLIIFPAFSVLFGGSQLAGDAIIQTPGSSINMIILGMLVKVAPLFITPFLMRFSGSMLSGIAKAIQSRGSKVVGSTRNFAKDRAENQRIRRLAIQNPTSRQFLVRNAQRRDHNRRRREGWRNANSAMSDARWANTLDYSDIDQASRQAGDIKTVGETASNLRYARAKDTNATIRDLDTTIRHGKLEVENAELQSNLNWEQNHNPLIREAPVREQTLNKQIEAAKAIHAQDFEELLGRPDGKLSSRLAGIPNILTYQQTAKDALQRLRVANNAKDAAIGQQNVAYAQALKDSDPLAQAAAGISGIDASGNIPDSGMLRVRSAATSVLVKARKDAIQAIIEASEVRPSDNDGLEAKLRTAISDGDNLSIQAYIEMLANNRALGLDKIRKNMDLLRNSRTEVSDDNLKQIKDFMANNANILSGAEDLANFARESDRDISVKDIALGRNKPNGEPYRDIWRDMSASNFAAEKFNTQIVALHRYTNNGARMLNLDDPTDKKVYNMFKAIVGNTDLTKDMNQDVLQVMNMLVDQSDKKLSVAQQREKLKTTNMYTDDPRNLGWQYSPNNPNSKDSFGEPWS